MGQLDESANSFSQVTGIPANEDIQIQKQIYIIVANVIAPSGQYLGLLVYAPISLALLAIGYFLRFGTVQTDHVESAPDSIT